MMNNIVREYTMDDYLVSTDKKRLDIAMVHDFLCNTSYWAKGIPLEIVNTSIENSLTFGVYHHNVQIGFARAITDFSVFVYLADVFIVDEYRGKGLSKWLMECIRHLPELQNARRWMLMTRDAHELYTKTGFSILKDPQMAMEITRLNPYGIEEK